MSLKSKQQKLTRLLSLCFCNTIGQCLNDFKGGLSLNKSATRHITIPQLATRRIKHFTSDITHRWWTELTSSTEFTVSYIVPAWVRTRHPLNVRRPLWGWFRNWLSYPPDLSRRATWSIYTLNLWLNSTVVDWGNPAVPPSCASSHAYDGVGEESRSVVSVV